MINIRLEQKTFARKKHISNRRRMSDDIARLVICSLHILSLPFTIERKRTKNSYTLGRKKHFYGIRPSATVRSFGESSVTNTKHLVYMLGAKKWLTIMW